MTHLTHCFYDTDKSARSSSLVTLLLHLARSFASWSACFGLLPPHGDPGSLTLSNQRFFSLSPHALFRIAYDVRDAPWRHTYYMDHVHARSTRVALSVYVVDDIPTDPARDLFFCRHFSPGPIDWFPLLYVSWLPSRKQVTSILSKVNI